MRTRWVMDAAEWMSGGHNSKQNDKEICGYSNEEWTYIWSTLLEDGAWAVPSIKDGFGNTLKENLAPEIFIKYIAHDLQCHIVVFDLLLGQVQFCSANHLKDNNALFDSPILLYATGSHFQAVIPKDQEFFIAYAKELEKQNNQIPTSSNQEGETKMEEGIRLEPKQMVVDSPPDFGKTEHTEVYNTKKPATEIDSPPIKRPVTMQVTNQKIKKKKTPNSKRTFSRNFQ